MKTLILSLTLFTITLFAQSNLPDNLVGNHTTFDFQKGLMTSTNPVLYNPDYKMKEPVQTPEQPDSTGFKHSLYFY